MNLSTPAIYFISGALIAIVPLIVLGTVLVVLVRTYRFERASEPGDET